MSDLPDSYLEYPHRSHGMDHDRYDWSMMVKRAPIKWPNGARVALWLVPTVEWFPLDMGGGPFAIPGGMARAYPDYWNYTTRDYGTRVGIYRIMKVLEDLGLKASVAMNSAIAERHPYLVEEVNRLGWEILAHGVDMGHPHYGGMEREDEDALVRQALGTLRDVSGQAVRGWLSPIRSQSANTPELVAAQGVDYICDWVNDELPYEFRTASGAIHALPLANEIDDQQMLVTLGQSEADFVEQIKDQFDWLYKEAENGGGRIMAISLHSWVSGQAYRVKMLKEALGYIAGHDGVWSATGAEIVDAFKE